MVQQIVDIITGDGGLFGLSELVKICLLLVVVTAAILLLNWYARPKFIYRATKQYKEYAFCRLTEKSIQSFQRENTATYLSALSNDVNSLETNYLMPVFELVTQVIGCIGALALMLYYSPS